MKYLIEFLIFILLVILLIGGVKVTINGKEYKMKIDPIEEAQDRKE